MSDTVSIIPAVISVTYDEKLTFAVAGEFVTEYDDSRINCIVIETISTILIHERTTTYDR